MKTMMVITASLGMVFAGLAQTGQRSAESFPSVPHTDNALRTQAEWSPEDELQIAVQGICPVSGEALGSMGTPRKVQVGEQVAFLCCQGCVGKELKAEHWQTIQRNIAAAQRTCPIMGKPVDASMKSTVVQGQQVFVCCPPCIDKIKSDVEGSLKKVNASYQEYVARLGRDRGDQLHQWAQGICPVTGRELGSMGAPVKVKVGDEEVAFLCHQDCVGKAINAEYWQTIQNNLAAAQGVCPIMNQPVEASMKSTVVEGRRIFVCCPPCIDKIHADPEAAIAKVDAGIAKKFEQETKLPKQSRSDSGEQSDEDHNN